ncbi:MAG: hypothetical protein LBI61_03430 [Puniceicoccales bacterium]|jgi:DNA polymerase-3 subunit delta'|nr:hypothetical protein [Puniceicoccales bacterium]
MNSPKDFSKIEGQPGFASLMDCCERDQLPNSNLLVCVDEKICCEVAAKIAKKVLSVENLACCVDFSCVRPTGAMAQISVDQIRELRARIYLSPKVCKKKFAAIFAAERMHNAAANAFLKTLEEPPADTVIFLTAAKPHTMLPTIAGRCSITRLLSSDEIHESQEIRNWLASYSSWLHSLFGSASEEKNRVITGMYSILASLEILVNNATKGTADGGDFGDEQPGKKQIYATFFLKIERTTAEFFEGKPHLIKIFPLAISNLEAKAVLVSLNVNFMACVEVFLIEIFQMVARVTDTDARHRVNG